MADLVAQTLANPAIGAFGTAIAMAGVALWLAAAWWAYGDAARRTESSLAGFVAAGWIILSTPLLLPLSLAAYAFARPQVPAADQRTRSIAAQLAAVPTGRFCATCAEPVDDVWLRCPSCTTWLASPCAHCGEWSEANLDICPFCGGDTRDQPFVPGFSGAGSGLLRTRRRRVAWRATSPTGARSQRREAARPAPEPAAPRVQRVHP